MALLEASVTGSRLRDRLIRAVEAATTPLLPADYLDLFAPLRSGADLRGRIVEVVAETRDAATIVIKPGADWAGHVPGQYIRLGIDVDGVRQWRAYSLTHGPRADGHISITVKAVPDGIVSNHLVHEARPGTLVHLEQATGDFVLDPAATKLLFVTAGSGVTPVIGMLRNLFPVTDEGVLFRSGLAGRSLGLAARPTGDGLDGRSRALAARPNGDGLDGRSLGLAARPTGDGLDGRSRALAARPAEGPEALDITVVHVAPSEPDSIFIQNLRELADAGAINLVARYDDEHGMLDIDSLGDLVPDLAERTTYACGPVGLLDALGAHHEAHGLELFTEQFRPVTIASGEGGTVVLEKSGISLDLDGATTILDAAEEAGVLMPSGCRMGICMGCVLPLREGAVRDLRNGEITTATPGETNTGGVSIQTCISAAAGPCHIDH